MYTYKHTYTNMHTHTYIYIIFNKKWSLGTWDFATSLSRHSLYKSIHVYISLLKITLILVSVNDTCQLGQLNKWTLNHVCISWFDRIFCTYNCTRDRTQYHMHVATCINIGDLSTTIYDLHCMPYILIKYIIFSKPSPHPIYWVAWWNKKFVREKYIGISYYSLHIIYILWLEIFIILRKLFIMYTSHVL